MLFHDWLERIEVISYTAIALIQQLIDVGKMIYQIYSDQLNVYTQML